MPFIHFYTGFALLLEVEKAKEQLKYISGKADQGQGSKECAWDLQSKNLPASPAAGSILEQHTRTLKEMQATLFCSAPKWLEESNSAGLRKLSHTQPRGCWQTGSKTCCPKWRERRKPRDYCSCFMSHALGVLESCCSDALTSTIKSKCWKQNPEKYLPSVTAPLMIPFSKYPDRGGFCANLFARASCLMLHVVTCHFERFQTVILIFSKALMTKSENSVESYVLPTNSQSISTLKFS